MSTEAKLDNHQQGAELPVFCRQKGAAVTAIPFLRTLLLALGFFLYLWKVVRPELVYHNQSPVFAWSWEYLLSYVKIPGDPIRYVSHLLYVSYLHPWLGALLATILVLGICVLAKKYLQAIGILNTVSLHLIPGAFLVVLHNSYQHPLNLGLGMVLALGAAIVYIRLGSQSGLVRTILFLLVCGVIFYLATVSYLVFAILCGVYEWRRGRALWILGLLALVTLCVPSAYAIVAFAVTHTRAYSLLLPPEYEREVPIALICLWLSVPLSALGVFAWENILAKKTELEKRERARKGSSVADEETREECPTLGTDSRRVWRSVRVSLVFAVVVGLVVHTSFATNAKTLIELDYCASQEDWQGVLDASMRLPLNAITNFAWHDTNRALYHLGLYPERMFEFPQSDGMNELLAPEQLSESMHACLKFSDLFYDLGMINESEHLAYEALSSYGNHPAILKRLIQTNTLKGRVQAARQFQNVLKTFPAGRQWADYFGKYLDSDPLEEPGMKSMSTVMLRTDYTGMGFSPEAVFNWLLMDSRRNRMAFEYLMAHYLLTGQLGQIVRNIPRLSDFDYKHIPTAYEEAILMYIQTTGDQYPNLRGHRVRQETLERFRRFNEIIDQNMDDPNRARALVSREFESSYWTYCAFSLGMLKQKPELVMEAG